MSRSKVLIAILLLVLVVVYFRYAIMSPPDALLTNHLATDLHGHFVHVWEKLGLLRDGFAPIGDYWVQRGGGFPAALNDQIIAPQELLLMGLYILIGSFEIALKVLVPLLYLATLATAYWYGKVLFERRDAGVVLAVAYTFSVYGVNQLEHLGLVGVQPFILLSLIFLEKTLHEARPRNIILTGAFLCLVFATNLYSLYFTLLYVVFRVAFHLLTSPNKLETIGSVTKIGTLFSLVSLPILLPTLSRMPSQQLIDTLGQFQFAYAQPPSLYFLRNTPYEPYITETYFMYIGLAVLLLTLVPMITRHVKMRPLYIFHLLVATFFMVYAIGQYGPVNIALWFYKYAPLAFFMQVPGRALVIGYLSLAVCATVGFTIIADKLRWRHLAAPLAVAVIFTDLTIGFEPTTIPEYFQRSTVHQFIEAQPGDFRVVEVPSIHNQQAMTIIYTSRDTLNATLWAFGHFDPLRTFADVYNDYSTQGVEAERATLYGVKYVAVNTDPGYFEAFERALETVNGPNLIQTQRADEWLSDSEGYELVYTEGHVNVYENLEFRGLVFSDGANLLGWSRRGPNTIVIDYDSAEPSSIIVSQSFADGWIATLDGETELVVTNYKSVQRIEVPTGSHQLVLQYENYTKWFWPAAGCWTAALALGLWLCLRKKRC